MAQPAPVPSLPAPDALPGGSWYELEFAGQRAVLVTADGEASLRTPAGTDLSQAHPAITDAATGQFPTGIALDGVVVEQPGGRPAVFMVFDIVSVKTTDLRDRPLRSRHRALRRHTHGLRHPLHGVPGTGDPLIAAQWLRECAGADIGVRGLTVKGLSTAYGAESSWLSFTPQP